MTNAANKGATWARMAAQLVLITALGGGIGIAAGWSRSKPMPFTTAAIAPSALVRPQPQMAPLSRAAPTPQPAAYTIKRILPIDGPLRYGEWHWDDTGVPDGPVVITVDLAARVLSVFRDGYEIGATAVIYGADEKPTPLGVFPVTQKDADHVSNIYDAPMPFMLRMTNDGISIHGSEVSAELMTHGCVGVPTSFAKRLFGEVKLGDKVIVTRGETLDLGQTITAA